jgi:uncharacterized protein YbcI
MAMETEFRQVIEAATGREVIAYMSSIHIDPDLAVEIFVLKPAEESAPVEPSSDGHPSSDGQPSSDGHH